MLLPNVAWALLVLGMGATSARGQLRAPWAAERLAAGQVVNFFASWEGREPIDGFEMALPNGWSLQGARALRGGYGPVPLAVRAAQEGEPVFLALAPHALHGAHELVLQVEVGPGPGYERWRLVPVVRARDGAGRRWEPLGGFELEREVLVEEGRAGDNLVLTFSEAERAEEETPVLLRRAALPDLGTQAAYTVEFWMKTTGLDEVVLSTWDGDEDQAYPFECVVDARGRLLFYRGQPGQHQSMTTTQPVADGRWHHVAVVHAPARGWTHLHLDGLAVDSLSSLVPLRAALRTPVAVGGRLPAQTPSGVPEGRYTGHLDDLRFWPSARAGGVVRSGMRQPLRAQPEGGVALDFTEPLPEDLLEPGAAAGTRVPGDLVFFHPVRHLRASVGEGMVLLSWESLDRQTQAFIVERSVDGHTFEAVHRVRAAASTARNAGGPAVFSFADGDLPAQVLYYRIRQLFENGMERLSGTVKLGLGPVAAQEEPLVNNFPNPFNATTTITYTVEVPQHVRVSVWDLSGQQVAVLVDEERTPGAYEVQFDAGELPSGTYFVRVQTTVGVTSRKMILMK